MSTPANPARWIAQHAPTAAYTKTSLGSATLRIKPAFSLTDAMPRRIASEKRVHGQSAIATNAVYVTPGYSGGTVARKTWLKTKAKIASCARGCRIVHARPPALPA